MIFELLTAVVFGTLPVYLFFKLWRDSKRDDRMEIAMHISNTRSIDGLRTGTAGQSVGFRFVVQILDGQSVNVVFHSVSHGLYRLVQLCNERSRRSPGDVSDELHAAQAGGAAQVVPVLLHERRARRSVAVRHRFPHAAPSHVLAARGARRFGRVLQAVARQRRVRQRAGTCTAVTCAHFRPRRK
jgi:hypothetical protein